MDWIKASNGYVPNGAIKAGQEADGTPLFVARAKYMGGIHIGKVRPGFGHAWIPYGGKEIAAYTYEVLCD